MVMVAFSLVKKTKKVADEAHKRVSVNEEKMFFMHGCRKNKENMSFLTMVAGKRTKTHHFQSWLPEKRRKHVIFSIMHASFMPAVGVGQACATYVGKYLGEKKPNSAEDTIKESIRISE